MSITKVAKLAGVSHATVSNVINNRRNVRPDTERLVRKAMKEIGYQPRPVGARPGRRTRTADGIRTGTIALVWPGDDGGQSSIASGLIEGISNELTRQGLKLRPTFASSHVSPKDFAEMVDDADGCLIHGTLPDRFYPAVRDKPVVWLGSVGPTTWGDRVGVDNSQIGSLAAALLTDAEVERCVYVNLDNNHPAYLARGLWFQSSLRRLDQAPPIMIETKTTLDNPAAPGYAAVKLREALSKVEDPSKVGVFAACDRHFVMLERECRQIGCESLSKCVCVACDHDKAALAGLLSRPSTFEIQPILMGELAVGRLIDRMREPSVPGQITTLVPAIPIASH